ncbi:hypothetical protein LJK88_12190 [Paenibacillus sp. P26]|nr:hypothetical protein LJK88_12190 [Paenibacillus sp. P26]
MPGSRSFGEGPLPRGSGRPPNTLHCARAGRLSLSGKRPGGSGSRWERSLRAGASAAANENTI